MYLLIPIFLSVFVAFLRNKDLSRFALEDRFKIPWLIFFALALRILLYVPKIADYALRTGVTSYLNPLPYIMVIVFVAANLHLKSLKPALILIGLGNLSNLAAILANGGFMPARLDMLIYTGTLSPAAIARLQQGIPECHTILMDSSSRLTFLADNFPLPLPHPFAAVFSVGDAVIAVGAFWLFQRLFPPKE